MDRIEKTLAADKNLSVRAFGLLFFGDLFDKKFKDKEPRDPTDFILNNPSLEVPKL